MRVKRGTQHTKTRRNVLGQTKGFKWGRRKKIRQAKESLKHAGKHAYAHRRTKKRERRGLWNIQINAAARTHGVSYSRLINDLKAKKIGLNRKVLAELAEKHPDLFAIIVTNAGASQKKK